MRTSIPRLRRIRFKDGRSIDILRPKSESVLPEFRAVIDDAIANNPDMAGFAIVAWRPSGEVFVTYRNGTRSQIIGGGVPQYVHDCFLAEVAVRWSRE